MSNYPPTPAFGGGFVLSRPPFPVPKQNVTAKMRTQQPGSVPASHEALRLSSSEKIASVPSVGSRGTNGFNASVSEGADGDREEGEISDVEMDNGELRSRKLDLHSVHQVNDTTNKHDNSNGKLENSYQAFAGNVDPRKAKSLTAQISALNLTEQPCYLAITPCTDYQVNPPLPTAHGLFHAHFSGDPKMAPHCTPHGNRTSPSNSPHSQQQMEDIRKKAQAAVLNLLPLKLTFKDFVDEGINPHILRKVFERIGLPIPPEDTSPVADARLGSQHQRVAQIEGEKKQEIVLERGQVQDKLEDGSKEQKAEEERKRKEKDEREREREAKRLILQEKLQKLKEKEEQKKRDIEAKRREEQEKKEREEREKKKQEEAIALKKKEEEMLQAEAVRKKEQELEELKAKKRIMQQKFEEMSSSLTPKPPPPAIAVPTFTSNVSPLSSLPSLTFGPATPAPPGTIPGLLLSSMDMSSQMSETQVHDFVSNMILLPAIEASRDCVPTSPDITNHIDNRPPTRKKRPVAADFDSEPSILSHQHKRRFGSFKEGPFIFELTEDEDEDAELDEPRIVDSQKPQSSTHTAARISRSPPSMSGGLKLAGRNGNSPPARSSSAMNGSTDAAKQLHDTEEKIRRLREEIQARQVKKKKTSATATPAPTGAPTRVSTPSEPVLGSNSSVVLSTPSTQLLRSPPPKLPQTEQLSSDIPGLAVNIGTNLELSHVSEPERGVSEEQCNAAPNSKQQQPEAPHVTPRYATIPNTQRKSEECESTSMREEAERLRMLLLSKRKIVELRQAKTSENLAPKDATPEVSNIVKGPSPSTAPNADINISESDAKVVTISHETSSGTSQQATNDQSCDITDTPIPEPVTIAPYEPPQIVDQEMSEVVRDRSESPPYEPSLEYLRNPSESPPYEPSLGLEEKPPEESLMDIDDADAEEGEIIEENMPMEVVLVEDDFLPECLAATHHLAKVEVPEGKIAPKGPRASNNGTLLCAITHPTALSPGSISATNSSLGLETPVVAPTPGIVTNLIKGLSDVPASDTKVIPNVFTDYQSPLRDFRSYRYHPRYLEMVNGGWRSLTFSNRIDPDKVFCVYEISGGKCNDSSCGDQHFRQISLSDDEILVELGSVMEGDTEAVRNSYRDGLRELITGMRARKVNDFETVAAEISRYRSRFFNDSSRVLRFTKG